MISFLFTGLNICLGYSKELSHRDNTFEYPKHKFGLLNKKATLQALKYLEIGTCSASQKLLA